MPTKLYMKNIDSIRSNGGFGLIEIMVALGLIAIMSGALLSISNHSIGVSQNAQQDVEITMFQYDAYSLLRSSTACLASLNGFTANDTGGAFSNPTQIRRADNTVAYATGSSFSNGKLVIQEMRLGSFTADDAVANPDIGKALLQITIRKEGIPIGPREVVRNVRLQVTRDPTTKIIGSCVSSGGSKEIWTQNLDNTIYYNGGNVGIGVVAPAFKFHLLDDTTFYNSAPIAEIAGNGEPFLHLVGASNTVNLNSKLSFSRARGTILAPANINVGDDMASITAGGYHNGQFRSGGWLNMESDPNSTAVPNNSFIPTRLVYMSPDPVTGTYGRRFVVSNDGNVGIGTSNPITTLHIASNTTDNLIAAEHAGNNGVIDAEYQMLRARGSLAAKTIVSSNDDIGSIRAYGHDGVNHRNAGAITFSVDGTPGANDMPGRITFSTTPDNSSATVERMVIKNDGNVGIGTNDPSAALHIKSSIDRSGPQLSGSAPGYGFELEGPNVDMAIRSDSNVSAGTGPDIDFYRNRGGEIAGGSVQVGDKIGGLRFFAWDGVKYGVGSTSAAGIKVEAAGTGLNAGANLTLVTRENGQTASGDRLIITHNGDVGIGTTSPSEKLHVVGNLRVQGSTDCTLGTGAGATNCTSDSRLKENITPIENALDKISKISGVEFDWNNKSLAPGRHSIGVIAQEIQKVFPTAVIKNKSGYLAVDYAVLVSPLIEAAKELKNRCEMNAREIASLKVQFENEMAAKDREIQALKAYLCSQNPSAPICK